MKLFAKYFFRGLLAIVPVGLTLYILYYVFDTVDGLLADGARALLGVEDPPGWMLLPGIGFALTVLLVAGVGFLTSNFLTRGLFALAERLFARLPLVKLLYGSIKDLIGAFVGDKKSFDKPVVVALDAQGSTHVMGFITRDDMASFGLSDHVAVYLPQSYNFAGNLILVPRDRVEPISVDSSQVMTFLVSAGVSAPAQTQARRAR